LTPARLQNSTSLPLLTKPQDALRDGLVTLKDGAASSHPVEAVQTAKGSGGDASRVQMLQNVYGVALPARMQIEKQILGR
jgi:proteasome maturation protein